MDIQISITGRIAYEPRFFPPKHDAPAMWSAKLAVNGPPTPGHDGSPYIPTRFFEVVTYGVAAIRAHESYRKGHVLVVQGVDAVPRTFESKDGGKTVVRAVIKVTATAIGLCSRYTAVQEGRTSWPPAEVPASPRLVQGATSSHTDVPAVA
ncbi:single-stranded DNA-binding protein [Nonomuraea aridisoli]|uniref:Single-stranded DNA-binding protein n=1 Tax=Nonomuraea aridisoli TaxID=2070368 RepID=A0A2W2E6K9_9ACTN|nr:single-stranded DNA-binding protein [Nonomuraea aridisoli]PZG19926.1 hypothetical protein C1J01_10825 [Nonomuraea aridisoli]